MTKWISCWSGTMGRLSLSRSSQAVAFLGMTSGTSADSGSLPVTLFLQAWSCT